MGDADIDYFIQQQKAKLANERQHLNNEMEPQNRNGNYQDRHERPKWAQFDSGNAPLPAEQKRPFTPADRGLPLTNRAQEDKQRALAIERNREYNALLEKKAQAKAGRDSRQDAAPRRQGLDIGHYEDERKALDIERKQEYNRYLEHQKKKNDSSSPNRAQGRQGERDRPDYSYATDGRYSYQDEKKRLAEERRKEYNDLLQAKMDAKNKLKEPEIDNPSIIPFNRAEQDKMKVRLMEEERRREYNEVKSKIEKKQRQREPTPQENYGLPVGADERRKQKEKEQQEYKAMLDMQQEHQKQMRLLQQGVPYEQISTLAERGRERDVNEFDSYNPQKDLRQTYEQMPSRGVNDFKSDYATENQRAYNPQPKVQFDPQVYVKPSPSPQAQYHQSPCGRELPSKVNSGTNESRQQQIKRDRDEYSQWRKQNADGVPTLKLELSRDPGDGQFRYERGLEKEAYKYEWRKQASQRENEPGGQRKKWDPPVKLSPRGYLDTDHIVAKVQRDEPLDEYKAKWRDEHRKYQVPKLQVGNMTQREKLNTDSIVEKIAGEKVEEDYTPRRRNLQTLNTGLYSDDDKNNYKKQWQEENKARTISETEKSINQTIAKAQKDASEYRKKWEAVNGKSPIASDNNPDLQTSSADYRKRLIEIRNKEYNDLLRKKKEEEKLSSRQWHSPVTAAEETPFPLGQYEKKHKNYVEQRKKDCLEHMYKSQQLPQFFVSQERERSCKWQETFHEEGLPLGSYEEMRQKLNEERKREYNEYLKQKKQDQYMFSPRSEEQRDVALLIKDHGRKERMAKMVEDRNKEYNEMVAQKPYSLPVENGLQKNQDEGLFHGLGAFDEKRKQQPHGSTGWKLNTEGEHRVDLKIRRGNQGHSNLQQQTDDYKANSLPVNESDNAKWQKIKERNDEYNQFLAQKNERDRNRFADKKAPERDDKYVNTIPGLSRSSAQKRRMEEERNKEYNEMLLRQNQRAVKQGWATPDYQDLLEKNRAREQNFRRANDIAYETDPQTRYTEWRNRELERDLAAKRKAYWRDRYYNSRYPDYGILDDPYWLSPRNAHAERHYNHMNYHDAVSDDRAVPKLPAGRRSLDKGGEYYYASLPLGRDSGSAQRRQKEEYRIDLQKQIAQSSQARQIERQEGLLVNNTGLVNPQSTRAPRPRNTGAMNYNAVLARAGIEDDLSPRTNAILGRRQDTADRRRFKGLPGGLGERNDRNMNGDLDNSILDLGLFSNPNPRATSLQPPAELMYQPSTFITANAVPALNNSVDEAYNFFATKNPLDPDLKADGGQAFAPGTEVVRGGPSNVPALNLSDVTGDGQRVKFNEPRGNQSAAQGMVFGTDDDRKKEQRQTANEYREELERQIAEKNIKKRLAKEEQERYDLKMEEEARNYDPFGKGGGGAPMRDQEGNVVSDLRQMRNDNNIAQTRRSYKSDMSPRVGFAFDTAATGNTSRAANSYRDDLIGPPPTQTTADGDPSFARGGHGIFGMPKTDVEKMQADKYKLDLKKQIEEKKAEEYRKKQLQKLEDEREQRLLEEQRSKMQAEYDEEQRRIMEKKEEARLKNEEMMKAAEEKKRELERQRREEDEKRQEELRQERERELRERQMAQDNQREKSPPIPVLQGKDTTGEPKEQKVADSPPIPAARTRTAEADVLQDTAPRAQSADVLNQLTRLRAELRKESDRVQTMLHDQEDDVEIYDPRQLHRPPPAPIVSGAKPEIDVFETAMNRNAVAVRRTPADRANSTVMDDFSALKNKHDSDSRKYFRNLYPTEPTTSDALEAQQAALLRQQEDRLRNLKERRALEDTSALRIGRDIHSSSSQLHSNSAFVDVNGMSQFPDDFEDMPKRNDSARYRRRNRIPSSPQILTPDINSRSTFGSQTSLNVDKLARKNEDRLRKLRDMQGDDLSLYDPEDVLNRFMSKQDHNRPPSRNTLLDDTWMRAGSKQSKY